MGNWDLPELTSDYSDFLDELKARDFDAISLGYGTITNPAEGMMRYVRASNKFQEYLSAVWTDKLLSLAGGGTGAATAADARTNLGLGTIAVQAANNVAITGGVVSGLSSLGVSGNATLAGVIISGSGAVQLTSAGGKIQAISSTYFDSLSGANLTSLNASNLASGTVPTARLGSGSATSSTFLRGDSTWAVPSLSPTIYHYSAVFGSGVVGNVDVAITDVINTALAVIVPTSGFIRDSTTGDRPTSPIMTYLSSTTNVRLSNPAEDAGSRTGTYRFSVVVYP